MRRLIGFLVVAFVVGCGASIQKPETLTQAQALLQSLNTQGADRRAEGDMIRAKGAIDTAQNALAQAQNQEYVNGISAVALRAAQTAEASNARVLAQHATDSLRDVRYARQIALTQAQAAAQRARADSQTVRADSLRKAAEAANAQLGQAMQQLQSLVSEMTNIKETARGLVLSLSDILFDVGQATLKAKAQQNIQQIAAVLKQYPSHHIAVEGYTDATGGDPYNLKLSQDRAASVRTSLIGGGIDSTIISSHGFGKANPVASNTTPDGRSANRRVEVVIEGAGLNDKTNAAAGSSTPSTPPPAATPPSASSMSGGATPSASTPSAAAPMGAAPTSAAPTSAAPTSAAPTSAAPTYAAPTAVMPASAKTVVAPTATPPTAAPPAATPPTATPSKAATPKAAPATPAVVTPAVVTPAVVKPAPPAMPSSQPGATVFRNKAADTVKALGDTTRRP